jgi:hypothetical protein
MKKIVLFSFLLWSLRLSAQQNPVVVELFTSQGCSSCPAADKNLTSILQKASESKKPIYGLSFHVDYWNYLGWKDPYSQKAFTDRQRSYAQEMNLRSIYTPQMVINGKRETIGSDVGETKKLISGALAQKPLYTIEIIEISMSKNNLSFAYSLDHSPSGETMNIALVEKNVENNVPRGENGGRKLHHDNVVRSFSSNPAMRTQKIEMNLGDVNLEKTSVVLYIQDRAMHVVGATGRALK